VSAPNQWRVTPSSRLQKSRTSSWLAAFSALLVATALSLKAGAAEPTEPTVEAREAYAEGARAYDAHDYASAAARFARADALAPHLIALKLALISATRADDAVLAMTLVRRAETRELDDETRSLADEAQQRFSHSVAVVRVLCRTGECYARVAGRAVRDGELTVVMPGDVTVEFGQGPDTEAVQVKVAPEQTVSVQEPIKRLSTLPALRTEVLLAKPLLPAASRATPPADVQDASLSRGLFWGGVALTGALGAATAVSGIDALSKREHFEENRNVETRASAQSAVERTNWLLGTALVSGAVTAVVGLFFMDERHSGSSTPRAPTASLLVF
jgi:hypothetical protein